MHAYMLTISVCTMTRQSDPNDLMSAALNHCQQAEPIDSFTLMFARELTSALAPPHADGHVRTLYHAGAYVHVCRCVCMCNRDFAGILYGIPAANLTQAQQAHQI